MSILFPLLRSGTVLYLYLFAFELLTNHNRRVEALNRFEVEKYDKICYNSIVATSFYKISRFFSIIYAGIQIPCKNSQIPCKPVFLKNICYNVNTC